ncbi:hypothetical protein [Ascidiimonas aurantiaca]|uniref:hypothetical protein n=1 Tax=Ascidiimonas aurantiaca TaxID=1685432 RepID=UPI0030EC6FD0
MRKKHLFTFAMFLVMISCEKNGVTQDVYQDELSIDNVNSTVLSSGWINGSLPQSGAPSQLIVPDAQLNDLNVVRSGPAVYKSNNPEIFQGNGWLMQSARTDASRGGQRYLLNGSNVIYLFHINRSGRNRYLHVLASNPNSSNISVSYRGSGYTNSLSERPLFGKGTGPSYGVAEDWLNNNLPVSGTTGSFGTGNIRQIYRKLMGNTNMLDARFEVTSTGPCIYYVVVTSSGSLTDAINASQGSFAAGDYRIESASTFAREAGIYETGTVTADNTITLPSGPAHIGFSLNTSNKFAQVEDQTSPSLMTLAGSSSRTYGNYGHYYKVTTRIRNTGSTTRNVKFYFASNATGSQSNATYNGPVRSNGVVFDVYTQFNNPRQQIASWNISPGSFTNTIEFYVPGLITTNQQIIYEVN